jgi:hypothetical protein
MKPDARIFLYEQNSGFALDRWKRSEPLPTPQEVAPAFAASGIRTDFLRGAGALPTSLWYFPTLNAALLPAANDVLRTNLNLSFKYILAMKRGA